MKNTKKSNGEEDAGEERDIELDVGGEVISATKKEKKERKEEKDEEEQEKRS
jgi:hypothetical protein